MKIPTEVVNLVCGAFGVSTALFLQDTLETMVPWMLTMTAVIVCDLLVGIRKSLKLDIHVSVSRAFRETMGKLVVYHSFVLMAASIDVASKHNMDIAMWGCMFIIALEGSSIMGNLLKPKGIDLSLKAVIKIFAKKVVDVDPMDAEELVDEKRVEEMRQRERDRWERGDRPRRKKR